MNENKKEKKTADITAYNREYMKKRYHEDHDKEKGIRLMYYYKRKYGIDHEEVQKYGEHLGTILKAKKTIEEIRNKCPQFLEDLGI